MRWLFFLACGGSALAGTSDAPGLAPPAEPPPPRIAPAASAAPSAPISHASGSKASPAPAADAASLPFHPSDAYLPDSVGALTVRPVPEAQEDLPAFLQQANYLNAHHDSLTAAEYLQKVALSPDISARDRARVILQLADAMHAAHRTADELCWLKIWMQLYPDRSEIGAVAYRMGMVYTQMGLSEMARDSFYLALSNTINHGQVQDAGDLAQYQRLTTGTLWALAQNEYQGGDWARAAELFDRYRHEAQPADPSGLARAEFLQADCYYQLRQSDQAAAAYQLALQEHPFHPLAPAARLRLYHLDVMAKHPDQAQQELEALVWTVRTAYPQDEAKWQRRTAELLLEINRQSGAVLPPLLARSVQLAREDKAWQADLGHYDRLAKLEATLSSGMSPTRPSSPSAKAIGLREQDDLAAMQQSIDALAPATITVSAPLKAPNP